MTEDASSFLLDEHVNVPLCEALRARGVDAVHALEIGLARASDPEILRRAQADSRIIMTRNYRDFAPLVQALVARGEELPGVLFLATSIRQSEVGAHVHAIMRWLHADPSARAAVRNSFDWLR